MWKSLSKRVSVTAERGSQLILGAPGQARVLVNGIRVRTGPPSQVAKLKLSLDRGRVRVVRQ